MLALCCALLTALLAAPGAALAPGGCPAPGKSFARTWSGGSRQGDGERRPFFVAAELPAGAGSAPTRRSCALWRPAPLAVSAA